MKIKKMKSISIAVYCLVAALWSDAQCMDNKTDILESGTVNCTANMQLSYQTEIDDLALESKLSQLINLEETSNSWASYLSSPFKITIQMAQELVNIATHNSKLSMVVVGLSYLLPAVEAQIPKGFRGALLCASFSCMTYAGYWIWQEGVLECLRYCEGDNEFTDILVVALKECPQQWQQGTMWLSDWFGIKNPWLPILSKAAQDCMDVCMASHCT